LSVQALIFDIDGTLGDTVPLCYEAFRQTLLRMTGRQWTDEAIDALFGPTEEGIFRRLMPDRWEEAMDIYIGSYAELHQRLVKPLPGIQDVLDLLRGRNVPMAVTTGKGPRSAAVTLDVLGLATYFEQVETGSPTGSRKAEAIRKVSDAWGLPSAHVAYLGDSPLDMRDARKAGAVALGAGWASTTSKERITNMRAQGAHEVFRTVAQFRRWVEQNVNHI
jgi:phosphoglycolate phosphatase-like HAD superfamily hydrolase